MRLATYKLANLYAHNKYPNQIGLDAKVISIILSFLWYSEFSQINISPKYNHSLLREDYLFISH